MTMNEDYDRVLAEMRPGGMPATKYLELGAQNWEGGSQMKAVALTTKMMKSYEARLVAIENHLGLVGRRPRSLWRGWWRA